MRSVYFNAYTNLGNDKYFILVYIYLLTLHSNLSKNPELYNYIEYSLAGSNVLFKRITFFREVVRQRVDYNLLATTLHVRWELVYLTLTQTDTLTQNMHSNWKHTHTHKHTHIHTHLFSMGTYARLAGPI
jgi:hypothetical protein